MKRKHKLSGWTDFVLTYIVLLIAASVICTSCISQKQRNRICGSCPVRIETKDSIIVKDSIVKIPFAVPGPSFAVQIPNPCAELCDSLGNLKSGFSKDVRTKTGKVTIFTRNDSLHVKSDSDSLRGVIDALNRTIRHFRQVHEQVPVCHRDHRNSFDGFTRYWFYITGGGLILGLLYRRFK